jgi:hypothetical protein
MLRRTAARLALLAWLVGALALIPDGTASAHRSGCHRWHTCPSDHATYRWHGLLCVSHASGDYRSGFNKRVVYAGRVYYCHR